MDAFGGSLLQPSEELDEARAIAGVCALQALDLDLRMYISTAIIGEKRQAWTREDGESGIRMTRTSFLTPFIASIIGSACV